MFKKRGVVISDKKITRLTIMGLVLGLLCVSFSLIGILLSEFNIAIIGSINLVLLGLFFMIIFFFSKKNKTRVIILGIVLFLIGGMLSYLIFTKYFVPQDNPYEKEIPLA